MAAQGRNSAPGRFDIRSTFAYNQMLLWRTKLRSYLAMASVPK